MAFDKATAKTPAAIGQITVRLTDGATLADGHVQTARFNLAVLDQDGEVLRVVQGDLAPHLTAGETSALQGFMATLRARAVAQILG